MTFNAKAFREYMESRGIKVRQCTEYQWQVEGRNKVNFYPNSKTTKMIRCGANKKLDSKAILGVDWDDVVSAADPKTPNMILKLQEGVPLTGPNLTVMDAEQNNSFVLAKRVDNIAVALAVLCAIEFTRLVVHLAEWIRSA